MDLLYLVNFFFHSELLFITVNTGLLVLVVICFCATLYLVTEIRVPDNTFQFCDKLNNIALIEWATQLSLGICFIVCRYFVCGFVVFPFGMFTNCIVETL